MIQLKNRDEIARIGESGDLLADTFAEMEKLVGEGIETRELDMCAHDNIVRRGGVPAFLGYYDYPASICISVKYNS